MNILILSGLSIIDAIGGAERSTHYTAKGLVARGHIVRVLAFSPSGKKREVTVEGVVVKLRRLFNVYWPFTTLVHSRLKRVIFHLIDLINPFSLFIFLSEILREKPDIVWSNMLKGWSLSTWFICWLLRIPVVATLREFDLIYSGQALMQNPCRPQTLKSLVRLKSLFTLFPDVVVGISVDILRRHVDLGLFPLSYKYIIGNPVDGVDSMASKRRHGGLAPFHIGWIGRFAGEKAPQVFLDLAKKMKDRKDLLFVIAGAGDPNIEEMVRESDAAGVVEYMGYVPSEKFLSEVDVLIVTSMAPEPFGRVVVEGFRSCCFVITSDAGGMPEINSNSKCGLVYHGIETLPVLLNMALQKCRDSNVDDFKQECDKYTVDRISGMYEDLFLGFLNRGGGGV